VALTGKQWGGRNLLVEMKTLKDVCSQCIPQSISGLANLLVPLRKVFLNPLERT